MQSITNFLSYSTAPITWVGKKTKNVVKAMAIGCAVGAIVFPIDQKIRTACLFNPGTMRDLACLNVSNLVGKSGERIITQLLWPFIRFQGLGVDFILNRLPHITIQKIAKLLFPQAISAHELSPKFFNGECRVNLTRYSLVSIVEEYTDRYILQQIVLPRLSRLFPTHIGNTLNSAPSRILIVSFIFAIGHLSFLEKKEDLMPQFLGGIVSGILAENFGMLTPIVFHTFMNTLLEIIRLGNCRELFGISHYTRSF